MSTAPTATFVLATDLQVGMTTTLGEIVALRETAKRVYLSIKLVTTGKIFEDHMPKDGRCAIMTNADLRPEYVNPMDSASDAVKSMLPVGVIHPIICLRCSLITEYDDKTTAVFSAGKHVGYLCGAKCATGLIGANTPNNVFRFVTVDRDMEVAGRKRVDSAELIAQLKRRGA